MRDVVIVPCYERPEYTHVCLEYLSRARGIQDKEVWLCQDQHVYDSFGQTVSKMERCVGLGFGLFKENFKYEVKEDSLGFKKDSFGNSDNLITSLKRAYESGASRIFLVEDDIMVAPDIFEWHEAILDEVKPFVSCATSLNRSAHFQINGPYAMDESVKDPNAYKEVFGPYSSHASAFVRENLGALLPVIDSNLQWGDWRQGVEQDLVIQKIMTSLSFPNAGSAWPYVPRAFNVGMYSYHINSAMKFNGTLEEKCAALRKAIVDPDKLREMSVNNRAITPVPTQFAERTGPLVKR